MVSSKSLGTSSEISDTKLSSVKEIPIEKENLQKEVEMVPPDGGWGWMIVLGSFLTMLLGLLPSYAFSIIFSPILMSDQVSSSKTAWIFNYYILIFNTFIIFVGPLCEQFGSRTVGIAAGLTGFLSVLLSAMVPSPDYLFFTFALLQGIAGSTVFSHSFMVVSDYFKKNIGLALGITSVGGSISIILAPIIANYLLKHYGYTGAAMILAAITLNQCVGAMFFQPVEWHLKPVKSLSLDEKTSNGPIEKVNSKKINLKEETNKISSEQTENKTTRFKNKNDKNDVTNKNHTLMPKFLKVLKSTCKNLKTLKYMRVILIALSYLCFYVGFSNFLMWIPFVVKSSGHSLEVASWISSVASVGCIFGRIVMSVILDRKFFNEIYIVMFGILLAGSSAIAFSFVNDVKFYIIVISCWGFGDGLVFASISPVMIKVMGKEMFPAVFGVSALFAAFGGVIIGPLIELECVTSTENKGEVRDTTRNYKYVLWMLGSLDFLSFIMRLLMPLGAKFDNCKYAKTENKEKSQIC